MSHAITRCPQCRTRFRVTEEQLRIADGSVRCGACLHIFQAEDHFVSPLLDATEQLAIRAEYWADFETWLTGEIAERSAPRHGRSPFRVEKRLYQIQEPSAGREPSAEENTDPVGYWLPDEPSDSFYQAGTSVVEDLPGFVHADDDWHDAGLPDNISFDLAEDHSHLEMIHLSTPTRKLFLWFAGSVLMILLGAAQYAWFHMPVYAQNADYREYYLELCRYFPCHLPEYRNYDDLETRELLVRSHPDEQHALVVDVLLRNNAPFRQEFPGLIMKFFNLHGDVVASREFKVNEYLGGELRGLRFIPAQTEVRISLELVDPGRDALGYELQVARR